MNVFYSILFCLYLSILVTTREKILLQYQKTFSTAFFPSLPFSFLPCLGGNTLHTPWNDTWLGCVLPSQTRVKPRAAIWPIPAEGERHEKAAGPTFPGRVSHPPGGGFTFLTPSRFVDESRVGRKEGKKGGRDGEGEVGGEGRRSEERRGEEGQRDRGGRE